MPFATCYRAYLPPWQNAVKGLGLQMEVIMPWPFGTMQYIDYGPSWHSGWKNKASMSLWVYLFSICKSCLWYFVYSRVLGALAFKLFFVTLCHMAVWHCLKPFKSYVDIIVGTYCLSLQLLVKVLRCFCDCLVQVGYPLVTLLLCLGDPHTFKESFGAHLDLLYKLLKVSMY